MGRRDRVPTLPYTNLTSGRRLRQPIATRGFNVPIGRLYSAIGVFWLSWFLRRLDLPWMPRLKSLSGILISLCFQVILLQSLAYLIAIYLTEPKSAIVFNQIGLKCLTFN